MTNDENEQLKKNNIVKDANIKELIEQPKEIKSPNWLDKNKFEKVLAIIESNKFNYKNKIGEFKYIDFKDLLNNIKNNTISERVKYIKRKENAEIIKYRKCTPGHKELLNLFDDLLDAILTDKTLMSSKDENEKENEKLKEKNENENENEDENEDDYDIIKLLIHSNEYDEETINQNKKNKIKN